jgi:broad specificity phosphatase PhoE
MTDKMRSGDYSLKDVPSIELEDTATTQFGNSWANDPSGSPPSDDTQAVPCKVLLMRHAEPLDAAFPSWQRLALLGDKYRPYDLNMPLTIPRRPLEAHTDDAPLTELGRLTAQMVGRGLRLARLVPDMVVSAPELRCVQTAAAVIHSLHNDAVTICVEPGLADWRSWHETEPQWLSPRQLAGLGLPVNLAYESHWTVSSLLSNESVAKYGERIDQMMDYLMRLNCTRDSAVLLIVGHGTTVAAASPDGWSSVTELEKADASVPYCAVDSSGRCVRDGSVVALDNNPIKPITSVLVRCDP